MGDYGSAVSQKGYDVKTCADRFLVYSSAFQTLKVFNAYSVSTTVPTSSIEIDIVSVNTSTNTITLDSAHGLSNGDRVEFTKGGRSSLPGGLLQDIFYYVINAGTTTLKVSLIENGDAVNITDSGSNIRRLESGTNIITINHNLGFYSPFITIYNGSDSIGVDNSYVQVDSTSSFSNINVANFENKLEIRIPEEFDEYGGTLAGDEVFFTVYIFLDDFSTIAENNINTGTTSGSSSTDYGIRISKPGYDVKTTADINCVLSSSFFTQIIHKKAVYEIPDIEKTFTVNPDNDTLTCNNHGFNNGERIEIWSDDYEPSPLESYEPYYVINASTNTLKLSLTLNGSAINITDSGTGTHYMFNYAEPITYNLDYPPSILMYRLRRDSFIEYNMVGVTSSEIEAISRGGTYYYIIFKQKND